MGKKENGFGLRFKPEDVTKALDVLEGYINERVALVDSKKITDVQNGVKFMAAIQDFAAMVGKRAKGPAEILYNSIRFTMLPNLMDEEDTTNITVEGVGRCNLMDDITCKVNSSEKLLQWLTDNQLEDIILETVNAQTLAAQMRKRMKANAEAVNAALKAGTTDPKALQKLQAAMPPDEAVLITPVVRAQLTRE